MPRLACMGALLLSVLVACDGASGNRVVGNGDARSPLPIESPSPTVAAACPNQDEALASGRREGSLEGDVDGDGTPDEVGIAVDETGPAGCRAFTIVETADGELVAPLPDENITFDLGLPVLSSLAEIDGRPGKEVIVEVTTGASTSFTAVFTAGGGALERMTYANQTLPYGDLFPHGGSVGHLESSDCANGGRVVVSIATPQGKRYVLERNFFTLEGATLVADGSERVRVAIDDLQGFPEFAGPPFASCD